MKQLWPLNFSCLVSDLGLHSSKGRFGIESNWIGSFSCITVIHCFPLRCLRIFLTAVISSAHQWDLDEVSLCPWSLVGMWKKWISLGWFLLSTWNSVVWICSGHIILYAFINVINNTLLIFVKSCEMFDERLSSWMRVIKILQRNHCSFYPFQTWELEAYKDHSPKLTSGHSSEESRQKPLMYAKFFIFFNSKMKAWLRNRYFKYSVTSDQRSIRMPTEMFSFWYHT